MLLAATWDELMPLDVSHLDIYSPVLSSQTIVDGENKDNSSGGKKEIFLHPLRIAQCPPAQCSTLVCSDSPRSPFLQGPVYDLGLFRRCSGKS